MAIEKLRIPWILTYDKSASKGVTCIHKTSFDVLKNYRMPHKRDIAAKK